MWTNEGGCYVKSLPLSDPSWKWQWTSFFFFSKLDFGSISLSVVLPQLFLANFQLLTDLTLYFERAQSEVEGLGF